MLKRMIVSAGLVLAAVAHAQAPARHIDFTRPILGLDGMAMLNGDAKPSTPLTLSDVAIAALGGAAPNDNPSGTEKMKMDLLAIKIFRNKDAVLSVEEMAMLKDRIGKVIASPFVMGAAWRMLDPTEK